eukprot:g10291.t1
MTSEAQVGFAGITAEERDDIEVLRSRFPTGTPSYGLPLDDALFCRYLRARNRNIDKAAAMLTATLDWRRDFGLPGVLSKEMDVIRKENSTSKMYTSGFDKKGRPILVMRPRDENTHDYDGNIKHLVYQLERARAIIQKRTGGLGKLCVVIDYVGFTLGNAPKMRASMTTLNIVQNHYPETLGQAFFVSPPFVFKGFWKVIYPFIDKDTKEKFCFVMGSAESPAGQAILSKNFDVNELEEAFGGKYTTKFDSSVFLGSPMDQDFREAMEKSWAGNRADANPTLAPGNEASLP